MSDKYKNTLKILIMKPVIPKTNETIDEVRVGKGRYKILKKIGAGSFG